MLSYASREAIAEENPGQLVDVTNRRRLWVRPCSEPTVSLTDVVQKQSAEPGAGDLVEVRSPGGGRKPSTNGGLMQQRLHHRRNIG
jgi:hypothetical protein